jgi:NAD(P)-dependent dehydrogenase (short-subunit alcohol dehydrogenase family)
MSLLAGSEIHNTNYSAAKAGMHGFTMALAQELAAKGVTVDTVSPGYIGAEMVKAIRQEVLDKIVGNHPRQAARRAERDRLVRGEVDGIALSSSSTLRQILRTAARQAVPRNARHR